MAFLTARSRRRVRHLFASIAIFYAISVLAGCGGGSGGATGGTTNPPPTSRIHVSVQWADRSRAVSAPGSALSAIVTLAGARVGGGDATFTVNRNGNLAAHTETYDSPEAAVTGSHTLGVNFYAQPGGAGALVATAVASVTVSPSGDIPNAITNVQKTIKSVAVTSGQHVTIGEDAFLTFTARDASGNVVAVTDGSAKFAVADGADRLSINGIVATGQAAGADSVTATVDGVTSDPTPVTVVAPVAIAYVTNSQNAQSTALRDALQAKHVTPTVTAGIPDPATLQTVDVLMLDGAGNLTTADAAKVQAFLALGRGVVLLGRAPVVLATGSPTVSYPPTSIAAISNWFGGATAMTYSDIFSGWGDLTVRANPGLFPLPPPLSPGGTLTSLQGQSNLAVIPGGALVNPTADRVVTGPEGTVLALAYQLPAAQGSGRVYWQSHPYGFTPADADRFLALLIAGTNWAAGR